MYKLVMSVVTCFLFVSCGEDLNNYLKHDVEYEKLGTDCNQKTDGMKVTSNTIGDRYEFQCCLDADGKSEMFVDRRNDTVDVKFRRGGGPRVLYKVIVDINTRPQYNHISIDGQTYAVTVKRY